MEITYIRVFSLSDIQGPLHYERFTYSKKPSFLVDEFVRSSDNLREVRDIKQTKNMKKIEIEDLKVGMRVDVYMNGEPIERGVVISIDEYEVSLMDGEEGFSYDIEDVEFGEIEY